jgi:hypothetical protein
MTVRQEKDWIAPLISLKAAPFLIFTLLAGWLTSPNIAAGENYQPVYSPTLHVSRAAGPIKIDGKLDDPGWQGAARATNFAEHNPGDQTQPPVETEVLITYDDEYLLVAFLCFDDPKAVRASLCERDEIWSDDYAIVLIDSYAEATWAYEISANPYGIQGDVLWSRSGGEDAGFDLIYESVGMITGQGYQVEMAIPFSSLRFPNRQAQIWKMDFWRNHPREDRGQYSWAAYDRDDPCWPCQWGTVTGIENVQPGKGFEILPSLAPQRSRIISRTTISTARSPSAASTLSHRTSPPRSPTIPTSARWRPTPPRSMSTPTWRCGTMNDARSSRRAATCSAPGRIPSIPARSTTPGSPAS